MTTNDFNSAQNKDADKYTGMSKMNFDLTPNVMICAAGGAALGLVLALWASNDPGIVIATVVVFTVLSGIFGMFV